MISRKQMDNMTFAELEAYICEVKRELEMLQYEANRRASLVEGSGNMSQELVAKKIKEY